MDHLVQIHSPIKTHKFSCPSVKYTYKQNKNIITCVTTIITFLSGASIYLFDLEVPFR